MAFTDTQLRLLKAKLDPSHVRTRQAAGATLHYIEGWHVIAEANRIFGFDGWDRETVSASCVASGKAGAITWSPTPPRCASRCAQARPWWCAKAPAAAKPRASA